MVAAAPTDAAPRSPESDFNLIVKTVKDHFQSLPDYQPHDLITQSQVEAVLKKLSDAGLEIRDSQRITKLALPDDSFLARQLSTPAGRTFMRKIARLPGGYSQLDRLSSIPNGQRIVRDLIRQPGGDSFVEYLTTTKGGRNLGNMVGNANNGADLNKPTGRIYTAHDLARELLSALARQNQ